MFEDDLQVTLIDLVLWFRSRAKFEIELCGYDIVRDWPTADFVLRREGEEVCRARKRFLRRSFTLRYRDAVFSFQPRSSFDRTFVLSQEEDDCGWVSPRGIFQNQHAARLPKRLPLEVRLFLICLTLPRTALT